MHVRRAPWHPSRDHAGRRRTARSVWAWAVAVYVLATFHRSSLGVAGLEASHRFDLEPAQLSIFAVVQLAVYGSMQVPVGVLVDRFGARRLLLVAVCVMSAAQLLFALTASYEVAIAARVFVGAGDAMVFVSVLRLVSAWFVGRRVPLMTALTVSVGYLGSLVATVPLSAALVQFGWTRTFGVCASLGLIVGAAMWPMVRDEPVDAARPLEPRSRVELAQIRWAWTSPAIRLGFWANLTSMFSMHTFVLLWGFPYLVEAQGLGRGTASFALTVTGLVFAVGGPVLSVVMVRHQRLRFPLLFGVIACMVLAWTLVLAWPGTAPTILAFVLATVLGLGSPAAFVGLEWARAYSPPSRLGLALAVVNVGAYFGALVAVLVVGICLDMLAHGDASPSPTAYAWAMSSQLVIYGVGVVGIVRSHARVRASSPPFPATVLAAPE